MLRKELGICMLLFALQNPRKSLQIQFSFCLMSEDFSRRLKTNLSRAYQLKGNALTDEEMMRRNSDILRNRRIRLACAISPPKCYILFICIRA